MKKLLLILIALFCLTGTSRAATYANSATTNAEGALITFIQTFVAPGTGISAAGATQLVSDNAILKLNGSGTNAYLRNPTISGTAAGNIAFSGTNAFDSGKITVGTVTLEDQGLAGTLFLTGGLNINGGLTSDGSGLTALSASALDSGVIPIRRFAGNSGTNGASDGWGWTMDHGTNKLAVFGTTGYTDNATNSLNTVLRALILAGTNSTMTGATNSAKTYTDNATNSLNTVLRAALVGSIKTNSVALATAFTNINFVGGGNTTVTGAVSGGNVTIGYSSSGGGSGGPQTNLYYASGTNAISTTIDPWDEDPGLNFWSEEGTNTMFHIGEQLTTLYAGRYAGSGLFAIHVRNGNDVEVEQGSDGALILQSDGTTTSVGNYEANGAGINHTLNLYGINGINLYGPANVAAPSLTVTDNGVSTVVRSNMVQALVGSFTTTTNAGNSTIQANGVQSLVTSNRVYTGTLFADTQNVATVFYTNMFSASQSNALAWFQSDGSMVGTNIVAGGVGFSGSITNGGGTASTFVVHDANKKLIGTAASSVLLTTLTDETGTGVAVFGTAPTFTTRLTSPQVDYTTNSGSAISPNMAVSYALLSTNLPFVMLLPTGVAAGETTVQTSVLMVTNTTAAVVVITPAAAPVKSTGTWNVTNVSSITTIVYPKVVTNMICLPIF